MIFRINKKKLIFGILLFAGIVSVTVAIVLDFWVPLTLLLLTISGISCINAIRYPLETGMWGMIAFPLLMKSEIAPGVYISLALPIILTSFIVLIIKQKITFSIKFIDAIPWILTLVILFWNFIGVYETHVFWGEIDRGYFLRCFNWILISLIFIVAYEFGKKKLTIESLLRVFKTVIIIVGFSCSYSLIRITLNFLKGGIFNYWYASADTRVLGLLGQQIGFAGYGMIPAGVHVTFSMYLIIGVFMLNSLYILRKNTIPKILFVFLNFFFFIAMVLTFARIGLISWGIGNLILFFANFPLRKTIPVTVVIITIIVTCFFQFSEFAPIKKIQKTIDFSNDRVALDGSTGKRVDAWNASFKFLSTHPEHSFLGIGLSEKAFRDNIYPTLGDPHSLFVDTYVKIGMPFLFIISIVWIFILLQIIKAYYYLKSDLVGKILSSVLLCFAIGYFIDNCISGESFFSDVLMVHFWGLFGTTLGYYRKVKQLSVQRQQREQLGTNIICKL